MKLPVKKIARISIVAAAYAALTMVLAPISYGNIQARLSEVLNILPFFFPEMTIALTVGCIIANTISMYGVIDVVFGSFATLLSCMIMAHLGKISREKLWIKAIACLQPVIFNAILVGITITLASASEGAFWIVFAVNALEIGIGEAAVMFCIGLPAMNYFPKTALFEKMKNDE